MTEKVDGNARTAAVRRGYRHAVEPSFVRAERPIGRRTASRQRALMPKQGVRLVHPYAHVGMIIRDRSPAGGIRPSVDILGPYFTLKRCCLLNHTIPKLPKSVKTARVAVHRIRLRNGPCSRVLRVRRPRLGYEPRAHRVDRNEIGALLAAGGLSRR